MRRKFLFFVNLGLLVSGILITRCTRSTSEAVAQVNEVTIPVDRFSERYGDFLSFTSQKDNLLNRKLYLDALIDEELLVQTARTRGWTRLPEWQDGYRRIQDQLLLNAVYARDIEPSLTPGEAELRTLYRWSKETLHVRHLFARTREDIDSLVRRLNAGESWDSLANDAFSDPRLAETGGDLGWVALGDLDPPFEQAAFSLKDNEISAPVRTSTGWSVIQVVERNVDPFLIESEYLWQRKKLERIGKSYLKAPRVRAYTDQLARDLDLRFDPQGLHHLFEALESLSLTDEFAVMDAETPCARIGGRNETLTVGDALNLLQSLSPRQQAHLTSEKNLESILSGLLVRQELLRRGHARGLDQTDDFRASLDQAKRNFTVRRTYQKIMASVTTSDPDSLFLLQRVRYQTFRDSLRTVSRIHVDSNLVKTLPLSLNG